MNQPIATHWDTDLTENWRIAIYEEEGEHLTIAQEECTSRKPTARPKAGIGDEIDLTRERVAWLHAHLGAWLRSRGAVLPEEEFPAWPTEGDRRRFRIHYPRLDGERVYETTWKSIVEHNSYNVRGQDLIARCNELKVGESTAFGTHPDALTRIEDGEPNV